MPVDVTVVRQRATAARHLAVVATTRPDGSVHASLVSACVIDDPVTGEPSIGMVVGGGTAKLGHLRRTRRATATFQAGHRWVSIDGPVRIAGPVDLDGGVTAEDVPAVLRAVFVAAGGTHDDWPEYDRVMAAEGRTAVFIAAARVTGSP
jgi:pyridoxamine 5'-phosphate oxidase-like protein